LYCLIKSGGNFRPSAILKPSSLFFRLAAFHQSLHLFIVDIPSLNQLIAEGRKVILDDQGTPL